MSHEVILRLTFLSKQRSVEVIFDTRLTLKENYTLLSSILPFPCEKEVLFLDSIYNVVLNMDIPLVKLNLVEYTHLYLFPYVSC